MINYIVTAALSVVLAAGATWQVQDWRWTEKVSALKQEHAEAVQEAVTDARAKERDMQVNTERIADETTKKNDQLVIQSVAVNRAVVGLRAEVARLNARPAPVCPEAAAIAVEASTARDVLGECSERYRAVASETDRLSVQVTGLQDYANSVCQAKSLSQ